MSVTDKVNIQLEVTGAAPSRAEIDSLNQGLVKLGVAQTQADVISKKYAANNKDVKEGLQALALAAAQVSPAAASAVQGFSALKLAQEGLTGVAKNLRAAFTAVWSAMTGPVAIVIAALGSILLLYHKISQATKEWEENQRKAGEEARKASDALIAAQNARQGAARGEARDIAKIAGGMGAAVSPQNVEDIQTRARLLQESVPTASADQALKAATVSITQGVDFNVARRALVAESLGSGVTVPTSMMPEGQAARMSMELSAARVTDAQLKTIETAKVIAPVPVDASAVGAFSDETKAEQARRRAEARDRFLEIQSSGGLDERGFFERLIGLTLPSEMTRAEITQNAQTRYARQIIQNNCIINNRSGESTGILGPPSESLIVAP